MGNIYDNMRYWERRDKYFLEYDERYDKECNLGGIYKEFMILRDNEDCIKESKFYGTLEFLRHCKSVEGGWYEDKD